MQCKHGGLEELDEKNTWLIGFLDQLCFESRTIYKEDKIGSENHNKFIDFNIRQLCSRFGTKKVSYEELDLLVRKWQEENTNFCLTNDVWRMSLVRFIADNINKGV